MLEREWREKEETAKAAAEEEAWSKKTFEIKEQEIKEFYENKRKELQKRVDENYFSPQNDVYFSRDFTNQYVRVRGEGARLSLNREQRRKYQKMYYDDFENAVMKRVFTR